MSSQVHDVPINELPLEVEAAELVRKLKDSQSNEIRSTFFSTSIYDTSWVSMVSKREGPHQRWLFPKSFELLLESQSRQGGWEQGGSKADGILNTLAALLSLLKHQGTRLENDSSGLSPDQLGEPISHATDWLQTNLQAWDIEATDQIGFEILIPSLLGLLSGHSVHFRFPALDRLNELSRAKLSSFSPRMLYGKGKSTLLHSLEAFIGVVDFDKLHHHLTDGSMMASPSSTAAFLMYSSKWSDAAESYLGSVISNFQDGDRGGCPSAFPSTVFETSWVLSTLLQAGYSSIELDEVNVTHLSSRLESTLDEGGGIAGFAPQMLADADDTAKSLLSLCLLKRPINVDRMVSEFKSDICFRTYIGERNPSFSANCNVLITLLHSRAAEYQSQITQAAEYLCSAWSAGDVRDKWNISTQYSMMLAAESFLQLLIASDCGSLSRTPDDLLHKSIPLTLTQILGRTMRAQDPDGSWQHGSCEVTAYATLTLTSLSALPWISKIRELYLDVAIHKGKMFLRENRNRWKEAKHLWVEKVTYASEVLSQTYCLAAAKALPNRFAWSPRARDLTKLPAKQIAKLSHFFSRLPIFSKVENHGTIISTSVPESYLLVQKLQCSIPAIFPRDDETESKYMDYIPFTWISCNNLGPCADATTLLEMMKISVLNYQADGYMEKAIACRDDTDLQSINEMISHLGEKDFQDDGNGDATSQTEGFNESSERRESLQAPAGVLSKFVAYVMSHPAVLCQTELMRSQLLLVLRAFLRAHVAQLSDNARLLRTSIPSVPFYEWVHTTSAAHTSCPYSFKFFCCLMNRNPRSGGGGECFSTVRQRYLAQDLCAHLSSMCRMQNDLGSVRRDREEKNLNSLDFPEFRTSTDIQRSGDGGNDGVAKEGSADWENQKRKDLLWLADHERESVELAFEKLEQSGITSYTKEMLRLFVRVTDLYGQMYVERDIMAGEANTP